jgi:hypothetical protein
MTSPGKVTETILKIAGMGATLSLHTKDRMIEEAAVSRTGWLAAVVLVLCVAGMTAGFAQQSGVTNVAGGRGGNNFTDPEPQYGSRVLEVQVRSGDQIDSVQMLLSLPDGRTVQTPRHGGSGGRLDVFRLQTGEYITGISGRYGDYLDSLQIQTNLRTSQLFGGRGGNRDYRIDVPSGTHAVGFTGRDGDYVDAIGLAYVALPRQNISDDVDLAGGRGGSPFTDGQQGRIIEIRVRSGDRIDAIQAIYMGTDGRTYEGQWHGGQGGRMESFRLEQGEYVTGLIGRCGDQIDSLQIQTNRRTSQRFGGRGGNRDFSVQVPRGSQANGFKGRAGQYLDAIGLTYGSGYGNDRQQDRRFRWPRRN